MRHKLTSEQAERARKEFQQALDDAAPAATFWQLGLLDDNDEDYVSKEVQRKLYEPELPNGGDQERRIIERLKKLASRKDLVIADERRVQIAMKQWAKVLPEDPRNPGRYYVRQEMTRAQNKAEFDNIVELKQKAIDEKQWEKVWFYNLLLDGPPKPIADFRLECLFLLRKADGTHNRMIRLRNIVGETSKIISMDAEAFHAPQKFRKLCLQWGNFNWGGNEKELEKLHTDVGRLVAWRVVNEVDTLGWYPLAERLSPTSIELDGIWFYGDGARANDGDKEIYLTPDEDGIYWHRRMIDSELVEEGYSLAEEGREAPYCQKKPRLYPSVHITDVPLKLAPSVELNFPGQDGVSAKAGLLAGPERDQAEEQLMCVFFRELCLRMRRNVGTADSNLLIGSFLSFLAAPEIFARHSLFPGLFGHGQAGSGKSTLFEWMMELYGFSLQNGLMLRGRSVSAVGLLQAADQYSNLPVWGDEFRVGEVDEDKQSVLHNGFNRAGQFKFNPNRIQRTMRTNFVVSGEDTSSDAATRGRFPHIQVSAQMRLGTPEEQEENRIWFESHRKYFFLIGRYVLERRRKFTKLVFKYLESWWREKIESRLRIVHGVGYASFMAMVEMLGSHGADEVVEFRAHMVAHSKKAAADVVSDLNVNIFIEDLITAYKAGEIPYHCFRVECQHMKHAPGAPGQPGWNSYTLYIHPESAISYLAQFLARQRKGMALKRKDLRDQLSKYPFWEKSDNGLTKRFGKPGERSTLPCWGIKADLHPLGYRQCADEQVQKFLLKPDEGDPRKGPLFYLIEGVWAQEKEDEREAANA